MTSIDEETFSYGRGRICWGLIKIARKEELNSAAWAGNPLLWIIKQRKCLKERKGNVREEESTLVLRECKLSQRGTVFTKKRGEKRKRIHPGGRGVGTPMSLCMFWLCPTGRSTPFKTITHAGTK